MGVSFEFIEAGLSGQIDPDNKLSILYGMDSFAWMVSDRNDRIWLLKECELESPEELPELIAGEASLRTAYREVRRALIHPKHTFVPRRPFKAGEQEKYMQHLTPVLPDDELLTNELPALDAVNVFLYPAVLSRAVAGLPGGQEVQHLSSVLLRAIHGQGIAADEPHLHAHFLRGAIWLGALENAQLKYCNLFPLQSPEDAVYYTLLLYDHLGVSPARLPVHISGRIDPKGSFFQAISPYLTDPRLSDSPVPAQVLGARPAHWFFDLFHLSR